MYLRDALVRHGNTSTHRNESLKKVYTLIPRNKHSLPYKAMWRSTQVSGGKSGEGRP